MEQIAGGDPAIRRDLFQETADIQLLESVVDFKEKCYHSGWANYALARPGSFKLLPTPRVERELRRDYGEMRVMIYRDAPSFDEILARLEKLEHEINGV